MDNKVNIKELVKKILKEELANLQEAESGKEWEERNDPKTSSTWEKLKYVAGQLGSYKVNGKFFGKKKERAAAEEKMKAIIDKKGNEFIQKLDTLIKEKNPEFPNNLKAADFLSMVMSIAATYDSIIAASKDGTMPVDAANGVINDLREYVKNILDVKLAAAYSTVDEDKENEASEEELKQLDEAFGLLEDQAADVRAQFKADRAARSGEDDKGDFKSTKIDTLKSNRLPLLLLAAAGSMGAYSWIAQTEWFKKLFDIKFNYKDTETVRKLVSDNTDVFTNIKKGEGVYKLLSRTTGINLDGNQSPNSLINALKQLGGGDADKGIEKLCAKGGVMMRPEDASKGLKDLVDNPSKYKNLGQFFTGQASGTGKIVPTDTTLYGTIEGRALASILTKQIPILVTNVVIKSGIKTGAGYAVAKGLGSVLLPIGIAAFTAGALVKIMREKGQRSSRAATLNALYQSLRNIPGGEVVEPEGKVDTSIKVPVVAPEEVPQKAPGTPDAKEKGKEKGKGAGVTAKEPKGENDDLYNTLKKTFQYIVNSRDKLGTRAADNVGTGAATRRSKEKGETPSAEPANKAAAIAPQGPAIKKGESFKIASRNGRTVEIEIVGVNKKDDTVTVKRTDGKKITNPVVARQTLINGYNVFKRKQDNIAEGKYISDNIVLNYLEKNLSYDKLKSFEDLLKKIEQLRNKIRNAKQSKKDLDFNEKLDVFKSNPIMATDFESLFNVPSTNEKDMASLKAFIDDIFITVYSGKFGRGNLIDKMASTGGGNINAMREVSYTLNNPNKAFQKDAQSKNRFKDNLTKFLQDSIRLFQHMYSRRRN